MLEHYVSIDRGISLKFGFVSKALKMHDFHGAIHV